MITPLVKDGDQITKLICSFGCIIGPSELDDRISSFGGRNGRIQGGELIRPDVVSIGIKDSPRAGAIARPCKRLNFELPD